MCEDAPCCGCCPPEFSTEPSEDFDHDFEGDVDDDMDGDHASALASAGLGTDEDYGDFGGDEY